MAYSDAFAVLPGGLGTLDEFFEAITSSAQLSTPSTKPVVLLDIRWSSSHRLEPLPAHVVAKGFAGRADFLRSIISAATPQDAISPVSSRN